MESNLPLPILQTSSALDAEHLQARYEEIRSVYLSDERPWVIGYSGGKDSTTALQLIWYALSEVASGETDQAAICDLL